MKIEKLQKAIEKQHTKIKGYKTKNEEFEEKFSLGNISQKRKEQYTNANLDRILETEKEIKQNLLSITHRQNCIKHGMSDDWLDFHPGPLTIFIKHNIDFWRFLFPKAKEYANELNKKSSQLEYTVNSKNSKNGSLVGTATDLLMGYMSSNPLYTIITRSGQNKDVKLLQQFIAIFFYRVKQDDLHKIPVSQWPNVRAIVACIICLAKSDITYRTRTVAYEPDISVINTLDPINTDISCITKALFDMNDIDIIEEVIELGDSLSTILNFDGKSTYNPNFKRFGPIYESDADLIINSALLDLKCLSKKSRLLETYLYQILGYYLLSKLSLGDYQIEKVGLINPRNGFFFVKEVNIFFKELGARSVDETIDLLKLAFRPEENENQRKIELRKKMEKNEEGSARRRIKTILT